LEGHYNKIKHIFLEKKMSGQQEIILRSMDSMLASAQLEAQHGITLNKFISELEMLREYPKFGQTGKFTKKQISYIKKVLDTHYEIETVDHEKYYFSHGMLI
jgi:hypothetical protein